MFAAPGKQHIFDLEKFAGPAAQRRVRSWAQLLLHCFSLIIVRPQGAWVSETGFPEPPAKPALPAGGTWKPFEASRGCSWSRIFAEFANQPLPHASGVALGSLGVDFGELSAPKNDDF